MLLSLGLILLCQLLGEALTYMTDVPVPGPVIGLVLCVLLLSARDRWPNAMPRDLRDGTLEATGTRLLAHLSLLFVPAGVGVVQRLDILAGNALPIMAALLISTLLGLMVTAWVFSWIARRWS